MKKNKFTTLLITLIFFHVQLNINRPSERNLPLVEISLSSAFATDTSCEDLADQEELEFGGSGEKSSEDLQYENQYKNCATIENAGADVALEESQKTLEIFGWIHIAIALADMLTNLLWAPSCPNAPSLWILFITSILGVIAHTTFTLVANIQGKKEKEGLRALTAQVGVSEKRKNAQMEAIRAARDVLDTSRKWALAREITSYILIGAKAIAMIIALVMGGNPFTTSQTTCPTSALNNLSNGGLTVANPIIGSLSITFNTVKAAGVNGIIRGILIAIFLAFESTAASFYTKNRKALKRYVEGYDQLLEALEKNEGIDNGLTAEEMASMSSISTQSLEMETSAQQASAVNSVLSGYCTSSKSISERNPQPTKKEGSCSKSKYKVSGAKQKVAALNIPGGGALIGGFDDTQKALNDLQSGNGLSESFIGKYGNAAAARKFENLKDKFLKSLKKDFPNNKELQNFDQTLKATRYKIQKQIDKAVKSLSKDQIAALKKSSPLAANAKKQNERLRKKFKVNLPSFSSPQLSGIEEDFEDDEGEEEIKEISAAEELSTLEVEENDIIKDESVPIWQVISVRYRKSAFPIFFERFSVEKEKGL